jgi:hypothetical protein
LKKNRKEKKKKEKKKRMRKREKKIEWWKENDDKNILFLYPANCASPCHLVLADGAGPSREHNSE